MVKVFVNDVDDYPGNVIAKVFASSNVGATAQPEDDEDEVQENAEQYIVSGTVWEDRPDLLDDRDTLDLPEDVNIIKRSEKDDESMVRMWMQNDIIIFNIMDSLRQQEDAEEAIIALHNRIKELPKKITFICLSSCLSWAKTKPADPEEPEVGLSEDEYRRRKSHPGYKTQAVLEKLVLKLGRTDSDRLSTYVITAGLIYGKGEGVFHHFFKEAWMSGAAVNMIGKGEGVLPTIHITDLCSVLRNVVESSLKVRFIVAVDDGVSTHEEIIKAISQTLGNGKVVATDTSKFILTELTGQPCLDQLLVNLRLEGGCIKELMNIEWVSDAGIVENIKKVVEEYRRARNLVPIRACILGPPGVGKSKVAARLCKEYKIEHVNTSGVIEENLEQLRQSMARTTQEDEEDDAEEEKAQEDRALMEAVEAGKAENGGRLTDEHVIDFYKRTLTSPPCRNQGFIMEGYCKTMEQAKTLYAPDEDDDGEEEDAVDYNKAIMPEVVIVLEATDNFLKTRIMNLPESVVAASSHYSEERFIQKLDEYRRLNTDDVTVANYFDELEIHPNTIDAECATTLEEIDMLADMIKKKIGEPRNYGRSAIDRQAIARAKQIQEEERLATEQQERKLQAEADAKELKAAQAKWASRYAEVKLQEEELLAERAAPMRDFLMKHIMPTLTAGMSECMKVRPEDPIDFLAEYLFKNNPEPERH